jgi:hypothetical protein
MTSGDLSAECATFAVESPALSREDLEKAYAVFKPRRLSAEELRDAMLAATGELNPTLGGIPNRPEINLEAALQPRQVMGTFASAWVPNPRPEQRHRRSLYALKLRGLSDPDAGGLQRTRARLLLRAARGQHRHAAGLQRSSTARARNPAPSRWRIVP